MRNIAEEILIEKKLILTTIFQALFLQVLNPMNMKKINYALLLLTILTTAIMLFTISCSKDGAAGPKGDTGDKGSTGAVGPAGPAGANGAAGSVIYSGTTVPAINKGTVGDYYLNTTTGLLYGPKTSAGWGSGTSLKGATGATGAAGSATLSGAGLPAPSLGKIGDYYLDKTSYLLYGPKSGSGWGAPVNLRGPAGSQGPAGNANVIIDTFTVKTNDWRFRTDDGNYYLYTLGPTLYTYTKCFERYNSQLTPTLLNNGLVLVYFRPDPYTNTLRWEPLPFLYHSGYDYNWAYETFNGKMRLYFYFTSSSGITPPTLETYPIFTTDYKIVMIPQASKSAMQQNHINVNKYEEVSKFLNIK